MQRSLLYRKIKDYESEIWAIAESIEDSYRFNTELHKEKPYLSVLSLAKQFKLNRLHAALEIIGRELKQYGFKEEAVGIRNSGKLRWQDCVKKIRKLLDTEDEFAKEGVTEIVINKPKGTIGRRIGVKFLEAKFLPGSKRFKLILFLREERKYTSTKDIALHLDNSDQAARTLIKEVNKSILAKLSLQENNKFIENKGDGYRLNSFYAIHTG